MLFLHVHDDLHVLAKGRRVLFSRRNPARRRTFVLPQEVTALCGFGEVCLVASGASCHVVTACESVEACPNLGGVFCSREVRGTFSRRELRVYDVENALLYEHVFETPFVTPAAACDSSGCLLFDEGHEGPPLRVSRAGVERTAFAPSVSCAAVSGREVIVSVYGHAPTRHLDGARAGGVNGSVHERHFYLKIDGALFHRAYYYGTELFVDTHAMQPWPLAISHKRMPGNPALLGVHRGLMYFLRHGKLHVEPALGHDSLYGMYRLVADFYVGAPEIVRKIGEFLF